MSDESPIDGLLQSLLDRQAPAELSVRQDWVPAAVEVEAYLRHWAREWIVEPSHPEDAARNALACAALVERGLDPTLVSGAILDRLEHQILPDSTRFLQKCEAAEAANPTSPDLLTGCMSIPNFGVAEYQKGRVATLFPDLSQSFQALRAFEQAAVAILARSSEARQDAAAREGLHQGADPVNSPLGRYGWLQDLGPMLQAFDDETILVLDPASLQGFEVRVFAVAQIDQLQILLDAALQQHRSFRWLRRNRSLPIEVSAANLAVLRKPESNFVALAQTFLTWPALQPDGTVPEPDARILAHQVERLREPAAIPSFEGRRILLLARSRQPVHASSYQRTPMMDSRVIIETALSRSATRSWLDRIRRRV